MQSAEKSKKPSILFIVPAPLGISPGQRFRNEHYLSYLKEKGYSYRVSSYYSPKGWSTLYRHDSKWGKIRSVFIGWLKRSFDVIRALNYNYLYIYREAAPVGPPVYEWIFAKILRRKIIYDFDDAIWVPVVSEYNRKASMLKDFSKVAKICKWSYKINVGNDYLAAFASKYNSHTYVIPTVVETDSVHNDLQDQSTTRPAIGWTGTFSTLPYLDVVLPVLKELEKEMDFDFFVIADKDPRLPLRNYHFIKWHRETEVQDLLRFHIGLMPLTDDEITRGKCGFKAIQYMSLGIPPVVSPVGVNSKIVDQGVNGFVCNTPEEWLNALRSLLKDAATREQMGAKARQKIEKEYSVAATREAFLNLFS